MRINIENMKGGMEDVASVIHAVSAALVIEGHHLQTVNLKSQGRAAELIFAGDEKEPKA